ncbi:MAG: ABC transporter permease [Verrucomicrobiia bacterium]
MNLLNTLSVGLKEIWANKFRSALTMLGIILGVGSLVAQRALVKGMENGMKEAFIAIGGLERVTIGAQPVPIWQRHRADQSRGNTLQDVYALQRSAPLIKWITPEMNVGTVTMTRGDKAYNPWHFTGTWATTLDIWHFVVAHGRMINDVDEREARNVCVIGTAVRDALFGSPEAVGVEIIPVGEFININNQRFRIIGLYEHNESELDRKARELAGTREPEPAAGGPERRRGGSGRSRSSAGIVFEHKNNSVHIPLKTMKLRFRAGAAGDSAPEDRLGSISFMVRDFGQMDGALQQVRNVLLQTHHGIEDFSINTQENWSENITNAIRNARLSGGIIAAISLLVGGVGIMNIMLASITERVREIGIRKAVGASFLAVFVQILAESVVIASIGGVAGLLASRGLVTLLSVLSPTDFTPVITAEAMLFAFSFSVGVGILAGLFPGFKAARLSPIQALRYE